MSQIHFLIYLFGTHYLYKIFNNYFTVDISCDFIAPVAIEWYYHKDTMLVSVSVFN